MKKTAAHRSTPGAVDEGALCVSLYAAVFFIFFGLLSCTSTSPPVLNADQIRYSLGNVKGAELPKQPPLSVEILDEANDGKQLLVLLGLKSRVAWPASEIGVRLRSLQDGNLVRSETSSVAELMEELPQSDMPSVVLEPDVDYELMLTGDASGLTDYQIEVLWGDDAREALRIATVGKIELENVRISQLRTGCPGQECIAQFQVEAELLNRGSDVLQDAQLGMKFYDAGVGGVLDERGLPTPVHEERIALERLALEPGQAKRIRLLVDSPANNELGEPRYIPRLGVVEES